MSGMSIIAIYIFDDFYVTCYINFYGILIIKLSLKYITNLFHRINLKIIIFIFTINIYMCYFSLSADSYSSLIIQLSNKILYYCLLPSQLTNSFDK